MKRILIVEDDEDSANELAYILNRSQYEAFILKEGHYDKEHILKLNPDLILLDINLPGINGEILLKDIRKESQVPIIMVTSQVGEIDEVLSMTYGADDYITKPYNPTILILRIQNIFKRMNHSDEHLYYQGIKVNPKKGTLEKDNEILDLTKNEMIIFTYLLNNQGMIVLRDDIMTDLWNNDEYINDNALTVNMSRLRAKLSDFGLNSVIETKKGLGYKLK